MHIVEELIAERAPKLMAKPRLFKALKPLLYRILGYDEAVHIADAVRKKTGIEAFDYVSQIIQPNIHVTGLENLPQSGACLLISNHPTGLADGIAVFNAIQMRRPDHLYLANADALRVIPKARDIIIPVEWVKNKRSAAKTKQTLLDVKQAIKDERCVVIFPSGSLARLSWHGLVDKPWESSAAMLAKKYDVPIIPMQIRARNSWLYYIFAKTNAELRDITLFRELINKRRQMFRIKIGSPANASMLSKNADKATLTIRKIVESL